MRSKREQFRPSSIIGKVIAGCRFGRVCTAGLSSAIACVLVLSVAASPAAAEYLGDDDYRSTRFFDGFLAIGTGLTMPFSQTYFRTADCLEGMDDHGTLTPLWIIPVCAPYGFVEGTVMGVYAVGLGVVDVLTFGIFELSYNAGIFDWYSDEPDVAVE